MALDPASFVAHYESSGNPKAHSSTSSASGLYGFTDATWAKYAAECNCGASQYAHASDAPASVQTAVFYTDYNQNGFADWTCPDCDPALTSALAADGGAAAFNSSGSTDPATYAGMDNGSGTDTLTMADDGAPPVAAAAATAQPFSWAYNNLLTAIQGQVDPDLQAVEQLASGPLMLVLALAIAIQGYRTLIGNFSQADFIGFVTRAAIATAFAGVGNTYMHDWVEEGILGLPVYFANAFGMGATPAAVFDGTFNAIFVNMGAVWHSTPWSFSSLLVGLALIVAAAISVMSLALMFFTFLITNLLLLVILTLAPIVVWSLLFPVLKKWLLAYVDVVATLALSVLAIDIILTFFETVINKLVQAFTPSGSPDTDLPGFWGMALVLVVMGWATRHVPTLVMRIGGGFAVGLEGASRQMSGAAAASAVGSVAAVPARAGAKSLFLG